MYATTIGVHNYLLEHACPADLLMQLSSCDSQDQNAGLSALLGLPSCLEAVTQETHKIIRAMELYGCLDSSLVTPEMSLAQQFLLLHKIEANPLDGTVCAAMMKTGRRAFADASNVASTGPGGSQQQQSKQQSGHGGGPTLFAALLAGALAGLLVDISLFPLDTIKTRLQSSAGFRASGGFTGLYQGIGSITLGSAPSSALFFVAYEFASKKLSTGSDTLFNHLLVTIIGEIASSLVRVPADVVKSRQQVDNADKTGTSISLWSAIKQVYQEGSRPGAAQTRLGAFGAFYTGWLSTIVREVPFGCIQFPLFSYFKSYAGGGSTAPLDMYSTALCGMLAGSIAGSSTTPLDVVKTRIMLAEGGETGIIAVLKKILREEGVGGLFKGVVPRTLWISAGGAIFLGGYDGISRLIDSL